MFLYYFHLPIGGFLCSLLSQWNWRFFFPLPESTGTKISSQNYQSLPTERQNCFYTYARMWYSHVVFKQFKSILFPRTSHRQNLHVHLSNPCTECVYMHTHVHTYVHPHCSLNKWPTLYLLFCDLYFQVIEDLRDIFMLIYMHFILFHSVK